MDKIMLQDAVHAALIKAKGTSVLDFLASCGANVNSTSHLVMTYCTAVWQLQLPYLNNAVAQKLHAGAWLCMCDASEAAVAGVWCFAGYDALASCCNEW